MAKIRIKTGKELILHRGQGYSLATKSAGPAGIDVPELSHVSYEKSLGDARFTKTVRARHRHGLIVVKVFLKPDNGLKLESYINNITSMLM